MGRYIRGELVGVDDEFAIYRFTAMDGTGTTGLIRISVRDPWDTRDVPRGGLLVAAKVIRRFEETGEWPAFAHFQS